MLVQSWSLAVKHQSISQIYWSIKITGIDPAFFWVIMKSVKKKKSNTIKM